MSKNFLIMTCISSFGLSVMMISGCGLIQSNSGFDETKEIVQQRSGLNVGSHQETPEAIEEEVNVLLQEPLTSDTALQIALLKNPSIKSTFEGLGIVQADLVQAGLLKNPVFSGHVRFSDGEGNTNVELAIEEDILDIVFLPLRKKLASSQFERAKLGVSNKILDVMTHVKTSFYSLQATLQIQTMRQMILKATEVAREFASRQREAGNISALDMANEQAVYEQAQIELIRSEADVRMARENLNQLLGLRVRETMSFEIRDHLPDLPLMDPSLDELEQCALTQRLDLAVAKKEIEILRNILSLRRAGIVPSFDLAANTENDSDGTRVSGPMWQLELPLFDRKQASIAQIQAEIRQSTFDLEVKENEIFSEVRISRDKMSVAREIFERYRDKIIPIRTEIIDLTQRNYNYMLMGVYQLLQVKQNEITAQRESIEALRDYWMARTELEHAVGGQLPETVSDMSSTVLPAQKIEAEQTLQKETHHHHGGES